METCFFGPAGIATTRGTGTRRMDKHALDTLRKTLPQRHACAHTLVSSAAYLGIDTMHRPAGVLSQPRKYT